MRIIDAPSPNHDARAPGAAVTHLVLHYTGMESGAAALDRLRDRAANVSSHYLVEEDGTIFRMVPEARRAWHAGISFWRGRTGLNNSSIGIEIVNPGHEWGYRAFPPAQMSAVSALSLAIIFRHGIRARDVVGHSDIAPDRKNDPGELFDWRWLATQGVGVWPRPGGPRLTGDAVALLGAIGYRRDVPLPILLVAFQRRWRQRLVDGELDAETLDQLGAVAAAMG